ncbi:MULTISPECIES: TonB-dependent receptor [unclassified Novosphingobium]|uniref:TonB-dependent receptor n=1 Tax=unclassified Novosphingobium TaxID=2644732 RepID=UPI00146EE33B|nr:MULTISPECIES: TonB-dependent receptor [unclassified Novosphingobium]NMN06757.1 outer membrane receptor protein involved in Fe transport [Novosphingobium sp. SG919]NMN88792.1 outer membrane receptor protein involved in Fe transport [Novosphingobium sp. SG916]
MVQMRSRSRFRCALLAAVAVGTLTPPAAALAQEQRRVEYKIEAGDLGEALKTVSRQSGKEIIFTSEAVLGHKAPSLRGTYSADEAVRVLIEGSGLVAHYRRDVIIIRGRAKLSADLEGRSADGTEILVTGSRIRGSEPVSPVAVVTRSDIEKRGISDLGTFARSIVQNYSGGQNPSIPGGGQGTSENVSSSSTLNFRGLGPDATLTLFNGHRVAYDAMSQGVDISAIPLAALDRVEVVTDGSSALYGSDAVGGVANVILRRDYDGATVSARFGGSTDGGDVEQQYNIVTGKRWSDGGIMVAYDFRHVTPITAKQRSYSQTNDPTDTLQSGERQNSGVIAGHQRITDRLSLEFDGQLNDRSSRLCVNYTVMDGCLGTGADIRINTRSWTAAPSLKLSLPNHWDLRLSSVIGQSRAMQLANVALGGVPYLTQRGIYTNRVQSIEASAEGALFPLPGGSARLALGGGARRSKFILDIASIDGGQVVPSQYLVNGRTTSFGYAEISLPVIAPLNDVPLVNRLSFTAAVRYENITHVGDVATPKLGAIFAPSRDIAFKFSWGKSFKAPTQYQSIRPRNGYSQIGTTAFFPPSPVAGTVLYVSGGNPDLKPERATNWTATASITPSFAEGLRVDASYFRIDYRSRAVSPIPQNSLAFSPIYSAYVTLNPSRDQVLAALSGISTLFDQGGGDPRTSNVVALVTNYLQNAAIQKISGVDSALDYSFSAGTRDHFNLHAAASYLKSDQQLSAGQPLVQLAGILYRPPHWRASSSMEWQHSNLSITGTLSYIGGTLDNRVAPYVRVGDYKSFDLVAGYEIAPHVGVLSNMKISISALNLFNAKPAYVRTTSVGAYHYDASNYPIIGRFFAATISKSF